MTKRYLQLLPFLLAAIVTTNLHAQARLRHLRHCRHRKKRPPQQPLEARRNLRLLLRSPSRSAPSISPSTPAAISPANINSGLVGPRVAIKLPVLPIKPYGEILFGVASYPQTSAGIQYPNDFAYRYVLGLDSTILPHIDWRVVDFSYGINNSANGTHAESTHQRPRHPLLSSIRKRHATPASARSTARALTALATESPNAIHNTTS